MVRNKLKLCLAELLFQNRELVAFPEIGEEEVSLRSKDARHLAHETFHGAVAVRRLDVNHRIEAVGVKGEILRIAVDEPQPR